ncbi:MAG: RsmD family RNA methyltransferase [Candidatus Hydrogenedentota bacterium]
MNLIINFNKIIDMSFFRIIAGKLKNRRINIRGIEGVRPISEKRREALFNILGSLRCRVFADLCAGCGVVGLEAVSRDAEFVYFIEKNKKNCEIIKKSLELLGISNSVVINADVRKCFEYFEKDRLPTIIYFSPPYKDIALYYNFFNLIDENYLPRNTIVMIDRPYKLNLNLALKTLVFDETRKYSISAIDFYYKKNV